MEFNKQTKILFVLSVGELITIFGLSLFLLHANKEKIITTSKLNEAQNLLTKFQSVYPVEISKMDNILPTNDSTDINLIFDGSDSAMYTKTEYFHKGNYFTVFTTETNNYFLSVQKYKSIETKPVIIEGGLTEEINTLLNQLKLPDGIFKLDANNPTDTRRIAIFTNPDGIKMRKQTYGKGSECQKIEFVAMVPYDTEKDRRYYSISICNQDVQSSEKLVKFANTFKYPIQNVTK